MEVDSGSSETFRTSSGVAATGFCYEFNGRNNSNRGCCGAAFGLVSLVATDWRHSASGAEEEFLWQALAAGLPAGDDADWPAGNGGTGKPAGPRRQSVSNYLLGF